MAKIRYIFFVILILIAVMGVTSIPFAFIFLIEHLQGMIHADSAYLSVLTVHRYYIWLILNIIALFFSLFVPFIFKKADAKYGYDTDDSESVYYPMYSTGHRATIALLCVTLSLLIYVNLSSYVKVGNNEIVHKSTPFQEVTYTFEDVEHIRIEATYQHNRRSRGVRFLYRIDMADGFSAPFQQKHLESDFETLFIINEKFKRMNIPRSGYITERFKEELPRSRYYNKELKAWFEIP